MPTLQWRFITINVYKYVAFGAQDFSVTVSFVFSELQH